MANSSRQPSCGGSDNNHDAWTAVIGGIASGFMVLVALWLITRDDYSNAAIFASLGAVFASSLAIVAGRRR